MEWLESLVLGLVQGLTEFLPVSSDGHLTVTQMLFEHFTGVREAAADKVFFDVMLHVGTLCAVLVYYRAVGATAAKGLLGSAEVAPAYRRAAVIRTALLAGVATTPLVPLKLFFMKAIKQTFDSPTAAGVGFLITAAVLLLTALLRRRGEDGKGPAETTWLDALLIGVAQMFAPLPGVSRSGLTVAAALSLGLSRSWAVGFSLLIAIPAILGATVFEIRDVDPAALNADRVARIVAAALLAGVVGFGAIIWLVRIVRSGSMWYFSVYLAILGLAVVAAGLWGSTRGKTDARSQDAAHGPIRLGDSGPLGGPGRFDARPLGALAGPDAAGPVAAGGSARGPAGFRPAGAGLVLVGPLASRP